MSQPKFNIGDTVTVWHPRDGNWTGVITYRANTGVDDGCFSGWEYEVSNAPKDMSKHYCSCPGNRWRPLAWESELTLVRPKD